MLTKKQYEVLEFISQYTQTHGFAPTYEEIAQGIGTRSKGSMTKHISALADKGYIQRNPDRARSIQIVKTPEASNDEGIPLVGKIAAGKPILAYENIDRIDLNKYLTTNQTCFLLEVHGESMKDCGIFDGDLVLIQAQSTARNGQIVIALVDGYEATLKRYRLNNDSTVTLIPENRNMSPMTYSAQHVVIQGILIAQIRRY